MMMVSSRCIATPHTSSEWAQDALLERDSSCSTRTCAHAASRLPPSRTCSSRRSNGDMCDSPRRRGRHPLRAPMHPTRWMRTQKEIHSPGIRSALPTRSSARLWCWEGPRCGRRGEEAQRMRGGGALETRGTRSHELSRRLSSVVRPIIETTAPVPFRRRLNAAEGLGSNKTPRRARRHRRARAGHSGGRTIRVSLWSTGRC
jgi:hypothetical protein